MDANTLYYGDNLDILRRYVDDESVDLIYLDPPFNSKQAYNVIFASPSGGVSSPVFFSSSLPIGVTSVVVPRGDGAPAPSRRPPRR